MEHIIFPNNSTGNKLSWTITNNNAIPVNPRYFILQYGTTIVSGSWVTGTPITKSLDSLSLFQGVYNFTILAIECGAGANTVIFTVTAASCSSVSSSSSSNSTGSSSSNSSTPSSIPGTPCVIIIGVSGLAMIPIIYRVRKKLFA